MKNIDNNVEIYKLYVNTSYILTIGVSGLVLCAVGSNLSCIAHRLNIASTELGGVAFMCRGFGSVLGSLLSSTIFEHFVGDFVLVAGLLGITLIFCLIPLSNTAVMLYTFFFLLGLFSSINDTGSNILTRKLRGKEAGPWLGINGVSFGMAAAIVPVVELLSSDLQTQYTLLAFIIFVVACFVFYGATNKVIIMNDAEVSIIKLHEAEHTELLIAQRTEVDPIVPHYKVELLVAFMMFCYVGKLLRLLLLMVLMLLLYAFNMCIVDMYTISYYTCL